MGKKIIILGIVFFSTISIYAETLSIGYASGFKPMTFQNEEGMADGFVIELFTRILHDLGHEPQFVTGVFSDMYSNLLSGELDAFATLTRNTQREEFIYWPEESTIHGWGELFVPESSYLGGINELKGMKIGLVQQEAKGISFLQLMGTLGIPFTPVYFDDFQALIEAVEKKVVFGGVANNNLIATTEHIYSTGVIFAPTQAYTTTSVTNLAVRRIIEAANLKLAELKRNPSSYYWTLYEKWLSPAIIVKTQLPEWMLPALILLVLFFCLIILFIVLLRYQVKQKTAEISKSLEEKKVLLKEIHHRVKNNMTIISSFLSLQTMASSSESEKQGLIASQNRIASMALVHELLYQTQDFSNISCEEYVSRLIGSITSSYQVLPSAFELHLDIDNIHLSIEKLVPFGMILNELVANVFKHVLPIKEKTILRINIHLESMDSLHVTLEDNGPGFNQAIVNEKSLGLTLVRGLVDQIEGDLSIESERCTKYTILIPEATRV